MHICRKYTTLRKDGGHLTNSFWTSCVSVGIYAHSANRGQKLILDDKIWFKIDITIYSKGFLLGWGEDSEQATWVLPLQTHLTITLKDLAVGTGAQLHWSTKRPVTRMESQWLLQRWSIVYLYFVEWTQHYLNRLEGCPHTLGNICSQLTWISENQTHFE